MQSREKNGSKSLALVTRTGFLTNKGALVRDIMYPKDMNFTFYRDAMKFMLSMACLALVSFACLVPFLMMQGF
jgi:cation-transporting ATPase 13A3/4/5